MTTPSGYAVEDAPLSPGRLRVRFSGEPEGVTIHHELGQCRSPCEFAVRPDLHRLRLSLGDGQLDANPVLIDRNGALRGEYLSRSGTRASGWVLVGVAGAMSVLTGVGGALGVFVGGFLQFVGVAGLVVSGVHLLLALAVGAPLASAQDEARLRFN